MSNRTTCVSIMSVYKRMKLIQELLEEESSSSSDSKCSEYSSTSQSSSTSSDDSEEMFIYTTEKRSLTTITNFLEILNKYEDVQFKEHFRMERKLCNYLVDLIKSHEVLSRYKSGRENVSPEKATYLMIWYLANTETFRQISDRFGICKSTAHRIITKVVNFLVSQSKNYITWPTGSRKNEITKKFKEKSGIDGIIGAIDGCHIQIKKPHTKHSHVYCNRHGYYSILLQAVCDCDRNFIDIYCGEAGSMHDSRLLKKSSLYDRGNNGILGDNFLLGDSAYPYLEWLIPPYKDNGNLSLNQKTFNNLHSSTRVVIEHAFGLLKHRFRRLQFFENDNLEFIVKCVIACTVLHNVCLKFNDLVEYDPEEDNDAEEEQENNPITNNSSSSKREKILENICRK